MNGMPSIQKQPLPELMLTYHMGPCGRNGITEITRTCDQSQIQWKCKISKSVYFLAIFIICIRIYSLHETRQIWGIWKLRPAYSRETTNLGQNRQRFVPCDLEIWWMTLKNNRASLLCRFKLYATLHSHRLIQTRVTVRKRPIWVKIGVFCHMWPWNLMDDLEKQ